MIPAETQREVMAFLREARAVVEAGRPAPAAVLPTVAEVDAHLAAGGSWLAIYCGGGAVRCYEGPPSQATDVRELLASGASLRWWPLAAESEDAS